MRRVMDAAVGESAPAAFEAPAGLERRRVCQLTGGLATLACSGTREEWFGTAAVTSPCAWHGENNGIPSRYAAWASTGTALSAPPGQEAEPRVVYPSTGATFWLDDDRPLHDQAITLRAAGGRADADARWLVDGVEIARTPPPWRSRWLPDNGEHRLEVEIGGLRSAPVVVRVGGEALAAARRGE